MVYFTCNHCGESLKKPAVEKHYNFKCRDAPKFLTCVDCLKDFRMEEYVVHTQCISELEKYSGKGFVAKVSKNSGQKKQESWLEIVRTILDEDNGLNVKPSVLGVFRKLQTYDNVPRKKAKFQNFVTNCMRINKDLAEAVWAILEKGIEKFYENRYIPGQNQDNKPKEGENQDQADKKDVQDINENPEEKSKKKKKKRSVEELENVDLTKEEIHNDVSVAGEPKKKKKKSLKNSETAEEIGNVEIIAEIQNDDAVEGERKKKKSLKNGETAEEIENGELIEEIMPNATAELSNKKKKKKSVKNGDGQEHSLLAADQNVLENELLENGDKEQLDSTPKKKKKSKKSTEEVQEITLPEEQSERNLAENGSPKNKKSEENATFEENTTKKPFKRVRKPGKYDNAFSWDETMFKILEKHSSGISVEDLKKKTLKIYKKQQNVEEVVPKLLKTFDKKLRKSGLVIDYDGIVKIK